jgi:hypothetical protein
LKSIIICGKGKIVIDTFFLCRKILKHYKIIYCYLEKEQNKINCVDYARKVGIDCVEIKNYESLFKSDDKVSNHMNFINDDDFEVLKY